MSRARSSSIALVCMACSPGAVADAPSGSSSSAADDDTGSTPNDDEGGSDEDADEAGPDSSASDPSGTDTAGADESGGEPLPSLVWRNYELTCPSIPGLGRYESMLVELATDVPATPDAHAFIHLGESGYWLNPSSGSGSMLDDLAQSLSLACGNGNGLGTDTVRVALGYDPIDVDGVPLRWDVREVECPQLEDLDMFEEREVELADGIDPAFVSAHYIAADVLQRVELPESWSLKPGGGRGSHLTEDGALVIRCGNGNAHGAGARVRVAFGYPEDERPDLSRLRWETYTGECPSYPDLDTYEEVQTPIADGIELGFVAGSYAFLVDGQWDLNPLSGSAQVLAEEQTATVNCGNGNALSAGTTARISLAYVE